MRRVAVALVALALLAAGCRGEGGEEDAAAGGDIGSDAGAASDAGGEGGDASASEGDAAGGAGGSAGDVTFDVGVTEESCPEAVNPDNGCIYLGQISDLTQGPFAALGVPIVEGASAFWDRVNEEGGIGGFDVDTDTYVRDNFYNPERHNEVYQEIKDDVLMLAITLGSPTTAAILDDMVASEVVGVPTSWTSLYAFDEIVMEAGANYCIESINAIDYALETYDGIETVMAIHYPGDYGDDAAAGARFGAEATGLEYIDVQTATGADNQAGAIDALVNQAPDLAIITTGPTDLATIVGQAAARGFTGRVIGTGPTWNPGLLNSPATPALEQLYEVSSPWSGPYGHDSPGHEAMREALGVPVEEGNEGYTSGWTYQYNTRALLEQAIENGDLTRAGLLEALEQIEVVDYEGMAPEDAGNFAAEDPNDRLVRGITIARVDQEAPSGLSVATDGFYVGPSAEAFDIGDQPCYLQGG